MKEYARLALLIVVLALSVGMLSTAINILGDITNLDLDEDRPGPVNPMMNPGGLTKTDKEVEVGGAEPGELGPFIMIRLAPKTKYLRRFSTDNYTYGAWIPPSYPVGNEYDGEYIPNNITNYLSIDQVDFYVEPLTNLTSYVLVAKNTYHLQFNKSLIHYPDLLAFWSPESYGDPYWVSWRRYGFSDVALLSADPVETEDNLRIPESLRADFRGLAETITMGKTSDYEKYQAIAQYLHDEYKWNKEFDPPPSSIDPVRWFLFNVKEGIGSHFNSAFILLARSIGLPARAVIGYTIDPWAEIQYVLPQQAYLWAEVEFEEIGWITFDATPIHTMEGDANITRHQTYTNITGNDQVVLKGKQFNVWGTVELENGTGVSDLQVEIILKKDKYDVNETGLVVGVGFVQSGFFNITSDAANEIEVGDYNLIAHTLENRLYRESYSDPPIRIIAETEVKISGPKQVYEGRNITYRGIVKEASTGYPLSNATLKINFADKEYNLVSDENGIVSYIASFPENGLENMSLEMAATDFYLGSLDIMTVNVLVPPPSATNILSILLGFPQNIIIALGTAVGVGVFSARRRKRLEKDEEVEHRIRLPDKKPRIGYEDGVPLNYESYEEGVVKLFYRFYVSMQRNFHEIDDSMTPREFETLLMGKTPSNAHLALGDLITSYEIAMYSNLSVREEDFKRTNATIELIMELIKNEQGRQE